MTTVNYYATGLTASQLQGCWPMFRSNVFHAWTYSRGDSGIVINLADSGIIPHADLNNSSNSHSYNEQYATNNPDDTTYQYTVNVPPLNSNGYSHGSSLQSQIKANGIGITGVAPGCSTGMVVILSDDGMSGNFSAANFEDAITRSAGSLGAKIISLSYALDAYLLPPTNLQTAINTAWNAGCLIIACAGNDGVNLSTTPKYPAVSTNCICVGGTDSSDGKAVFSDLPGASDYGDISSNYGSPVNITAPARHITAANAVTWSGTQWTGYYDDFGTSFSAPHVAAIAGIVWSINTALTNSQVRAILLAATSLSANPGSYNSYFPNAGIASAGKAAAMAYATLSANIGVPVPYIHFYGAGVTETITSGAITASLNGSLMVDIAGYCDAAHPVTSIQVYAGSVKVYDGLAANTPAVATSGSNLITITVNTATASITKTYSDIHVGTLILAQPTDSITNYHAAGIRDALIGHCWHLPRMGATHAWKYTKGAGVTMGVVGQGWQNYTDLPTIPAGNCWNEFSGNNSDMGDAWWDPSQGPCHDSVVLSCIAAQHNTNGVAGLAPDATLVYVSTQDVNTPAYVNAETSPQTVYNAFLKAQSMGARVITSSLVSTIISNASSAVQTAWTNAMNTLWNGGTGGVLTFFASNESHSLFANNNPEYPSTLSYIITVGAMGTTDSINTTNGSGSDYGPGITMTAPGINILAAAPSNYYDFFDGSTGYPYDIGTSFAAPLAASAAVLALAINPALTNQQLYNLMLAATDRAYNSAYYTYFQQNTGIASAGKAVAIARATLSVNANRPIPYVNFIGPNVTTTFNISTGITSTAVSGTVLVDVNGWCNYNASTGSNAVTTVELWVGSTQIYSGAPTVLSGTATSGSNAVKIVAHSSAGSTTELYADITIGSITLSGTTTTTGSGTTTTGSGTTTTTTTTGSGTTTTTAPTTTTTTTTTTTAAPIPKPIRIMFNGTMLSFPQTPGGPFRINTAAGVVCMGLDTVGVIAINTPYGVRYLK